MSFVHVVDLSALILSGLGSLALALAPPVLKPGMTYQDLEDGPANRRKARISHRMRWGGLALVLLAIALQVAMLGR